MRSLSVFFLIAAFAGVAPASAQPPAVPNMVDSPTVKVLTGLTVHEFETEMQLISTSLGVSCGFCHERRNFASDANPHKIKARMMIEMVKGLNEKYFPDYKPTGEDESRLGRVTCFTCHQGNQLPKSAP